MAHRRFISAVGSGLLVLLLSAPAFAAGPYAYITRGWTNLVDVIDTSSASVVGTVAVGDQPVGVAVTPTRAYVANTLSNTVSVIDTTTNTVVATIPVGQRPYGVAADAANQRVYVTNQNDNSVSVIDAANNTVVATVGVGVRPVGVAVHPSGTKVFVTSPGSGTLDVIETAGPALDASITIGNAVAGVAVSPDGTRVWIPYHSGGGRLAVFETETGNVTSISIDSFPFGVAVDPQGSRVYVGHIGGAVTVVEAATSAVLKVISAGLLGAFGLTVHPTVPELWVAAEDIQYVAVVDTASMAVTKMVRVWDGPAAFGTFISGTAQDPGCSDALSTAVEAAVGTVEVEMRRHFHGDFEVPGGTSSARLTRLAQGVKHLTRGHLMGVYQNLQGPQAPAVADPETCDESLKLAVEQALHELETELQAIDGKFHLPGNGLVSQLNNLANAVVKLDRGRLQGLYWNLR